MKIGIIGAGASGTYLAIRIKKLYPHDDVLLFDHNDKLLKKIYVTGNGRCNYLNKSQIINQYNQQFANEIINQYNWNYLKSFFSSIGIETTFIDDLGYPFSLSAKTVANKFIKQIKEYNVEVHLNEDAIDYSYKNKSIELITNQGNYQLDKIVFACGGKSGKNLGNDGTGLTILRKHCYQIKELSPSLCPIKIKENVHQISGQRVKSRVFLLQGEKVLFDETGEVLFKDDGLSGIVIFNLSKVINQLDNKTDLKVKLSITNCSVSKERFDSYLSPELASYFMNHDYTDLNNIIFTYKGLYDFSSSQVSSGGLLLSEVNHTNLMSKRENNVYFAGELLDVDAICGGYNLMWAFASSELIANHIKDEK